MSNINVVRKNLGPVTAYKYAVQQGYTGTEQEFAALMASYATVAEEAEAAKDDAIDAKTAAEEARAAAEAAAQSLVIDSTLTQSGQAADAKATGDAINELKSALTISGLITNISNTSFRESDGTIVHSDIRLTTNKIMFPFNQAVRFDQTGISGSSKNFGWYFWVADAQPTSFTWSGWKTADVTDVSVETGKIYVFTWKNSDNSSISISDLTGSSLIGGFYPKYKESLEITMQDTTKLKNEVFCKNLVGDNAGELYPCYIPAGTYITMSTSDGSNNTISGLQLFMFDSRKTRVECYTFSMNVNSRTVKYDAGDIYYLAFNKKASVPLQVEIGSEKTAYQVYFYPPSALTPIIEKNSKAIPPMENALMRLKNALTFKDTKLGYPYGQELSSDAWDCTGYYEVEPGQAIYYHLFGSNANSSALAFYNPAKGAISASSIASVYGEAVGTAIVPENAKFVRFCNQKNKDGEVIFYSAVPDHSWMLSDKVPYYWNNAIATDEATIKGNRDNMSANNVEFMFITDTHWKYNAQKSPYIINRIAKDMECENVIFGGDQISGYNSSKDGALAELRALYVPFARDLKFDSSIGNHDLNSNGNNDSSLYISMNQAYNIMFKRTESFAKNNIPLGCNYWDNENQKVRFIQLFRLRDQRLSNDVQNWVTNVISGMDSGWNVVFFSHAFWSSAEVGEPLVTSSNGKADVDFLVGLCEANSVEAIAWIVGHTHRDYSEVVENNKSLLVICTTTDSYVYGDDESGYSMTVGTDTEQAFDYFQIDTENKTITTTRIGAGNNRSWTYGT